MASPAIGINAVSRMALFTESLVVIMALQAGILKADVPLFRNSASFASLACERTVDVFVDFIGDATVRLRVRVGMFVLCSSDEGFSDC